jgi:hypothetical protein
MTAMSPAQTERNRKGGRALHSPDTLAKRLSRAWPELDDRTREAVGAILGPLVSQPADQHVARLIPGADLGPGACDKCDAQVEHLFHDAEIYQVCAKCLGGGRDA